MVEKHILTKKCLQQKTQNSNKQLICDSYPSHQIIIFKHTKQTHYEKDDLQNQTKIQTLKASVDNLRMLNRKTICIRSSVGRATGF